MRLEWWAEHRPIFKNNENAHHLHVSFTPETGTELPKTGVSFLLGWVDVAFSRDGRPRETNAPSPPNRLRRGRFDWINRRPITELKYIVVSKRAKRETYSDSERNLSDKTQSRSSRHAAENSKAGERAAVLLLNSTYRCSDILVIYTILYLQRR